VEPLIIPTQALGADPNTFALSWPAITEVLTAIIVLAFLLERALAPLFESSWFVNWIRSAEGTHREDIKPLTAFVLSAMVCIAWGFDAVSIVLLQESSTVLGAILTGAVIAGGAKASLRLFRDILHVRSSVSVPKKQTEATASPSAPVGGKQERSA